MECQRLVGQNHEWQFPRELPFDQFTKAKSPKSGASYLAALEKFFRAGGRCLPLPGAGRPSPDAGRSELLPRYGCDCGWAVLRRAGAERPSPDAGRSELLPRYGCDCGCAVLRRAGAVRPSPDSG